MDVEKLHSIEGELEGTLHRVARMQELRPAEASVCKSMQSAVCPASFKCMMDQVVAADGHSEATSA